MLHNLVTQPAQKKLCVVKGYWHALAVFSHTLDHTKKLNLEQKYTLLNEKYLFLSFQCFFRGQRLCGHGVLCGQPVYHHHPLLVILLEPETSSMLVALAWREIASFSFSFLVTIFKIKSGSPCLKSSIIVFISLKIEKMLLIWFPSVSSFVSMAIFALNIVNISWYNSL